MKNKYKAKYQREHGIIWNGWMYDIHHINGNHEDNSIDNLILLPKDLHRRIHSALKSQSIMDRDGDGLDFEWSIWSFLKDFNYRKKDGQFIEVEGIWSAK